MLLCFALPALRKQKFVFVERTIQKRREKQEEKKYLHKLHKVHSRDWTGEFSPSGEKREKKMREKNERISILAKITEIKNFS